MIKTQIQINVDKRSLSPMFVQYLSLILGVEADDPSITFSCGAWRRMATKNEALSDYEPERKTLMELMASYSDAATLCFTSNAYVFDR